MKMGRILTVKLKVGNFLVVLVVFRFPHLMKSGG